MKELDFFLGKAMCNLKEGNLVAAELYLKERKTTRNSGCAVCRVIPEYKANDIASNYSYNVGSAIKYICSFTRTESKKDLQKAINHIIKERDFESEKN